MRPGSAGNLVAGALLLAATLGAQPRTVTVADSAQLQAALAAPPRPKAR
jgi:hypothetical protein